jgi:hypothetical protein
MDGAGPTEASPLLAALKEDHCGKTPQTIVAGELHIIPLIDLDLGQTESAFILVNDPLQVRCEGMTGGTPIRPEIHQDRVAVRRIDDVRLKTRVVDGKEKRFRVSDVHRGQISEDAYLSTILAGADDSPEGKAQRPPKRLAGWYG